MEDKVTKSIQSDLVGQEISDFRPCAYFDKHMDCIRVFTHDRSVTEIRMDEVVTIHYNNSPQGDLDSEYIGFTIKGINHIFAQIGLPQEGVVRLAEIVDRYIKLRPASSMSAVMRLVYERYETLGDTSVDFSEAA